MQQCTFALCSFLERSGTFRAMEETAWWASGWLGISSLSSPSAPEEFTNTEQPSPHVFTCIHLTHPIRCTCRSCFYIQVTILFFIVRMFKAREHMEEGAPWV